MNKVAAASFTFVAAVLCAACDKSPTAPTPPTGPTSPAGPPVVQSLVIAGPEVVGLGATGQFRVMAHLSEGSSRDVTTEANWSAASGGLISVSAPGSVNGLERGETRVSAEFDGRRESKVVMVLPAGTYRLTGTVIEADSSGPVTGALVEVTTGVGARLTARTDRTGTYRLYGVSGQTGLRVTRDGYQPTAGTAFVTDQSASHNIALPLVAPRADVSGIYTLTITAADECRHGVGEGRLPEEARVRTYRAAVRQDGPRVEMTLSGARLRSRPILGRLEPGRVVFDLNWYSESGTDDRPILEQLAASMFFSVGGGVTATISPSRLAGAFYGEFHVLDTDRYTARPIAECSSETHQFVLSR
jgi:hypothetical protein